MNTAVRDFYEAAWAEHGPTANGLGWSSEEGQIKRFDVLAEMIGEGSVLDIGCGFGQFSERCGPHYVGIDLMPQHIAEAQLRYPSRAFISADATDLALPYADYVVASGVFVTCDGATMRTLLHRMWEAARYGMAFNLYEPMLSQEHQQSIANGVAADLGCTAWEARFGYLPDDITVALYHT